MKRKILFSILLGITIIGLGNDRVDAAATYADTLPDTITTTSSAGVGGVPYGLTHYIAASGIELSNTNISNYPFYAVDSTGKYQLYCSDRSKGDIGPGVTLTKGSELDYGLAYILMNSYPSKELVGTKATTPASTDTIVQHMPDIWVTQAAIWSYQGSLAATEPSDVTLRSMLITSDTSDFTYSSLSGKILYNSYVVPLVASAKSATNPATASDILKFNFDGNWSIDENTGIAKSNLITLTSTQPTVSLTSYKLTMENAPASTKVYNENGQDITSTIDNMSTNKFYIEVDTNKQETDASFKVTATGAKLTYQTVYQYVDASTQCKNSSGASVQCQPTLLVGPKTRDLSAAIDLKVTYAPDTAFGVSKSTYILGFIILICGAAIIYANVKPKKDEIKI